MNARLYDPVLGRMLSPDNFVHDDAGLNGYNRYSYALNNPLKFTDPDGNHPVIAAILIGAAVGAFTGGAMANGGNLNPFQWNSSNTFAGIFMGALIGGISGMGGALVSGAITANVAGAGGAILGSSVGFGVSNALTNVGNLAANGGGDFAGGALSGFVSGLASGAVFGCLGAIAPGFGQNLILRYSLKTAYAAGAGAAVSVAGTFASDILDGQLNSDYGQAALDGAAFGAAFAVGECAVDYLTWNRFNTFEKIAILQKKFGDKNIKWTLGKFYGYYEHKTDIIYLTEEYALQSKSLAENTYIHEVVHRQQYKANPAEYLTVYNMTPPPSPHPFEVPAHLHDINNSGLHLAGRHIALSRHVLKFSYGYQGDTPNPWGFGQIWYNYFRF